MAVVWTNTNALPRTAQTAAGCGTKTASFILNGYAGAADIHTYTFDGTSFTASTDYGHPFSGGFNVGSQSSALAGGGYNHTASANCIDTNKFNGTTWSSGGDLPAANRTLGGAGTQSAAVAFGGYTTSVSNATYSYNGTSWSTPSATLSSGRYEVRGGGTATAAICIGGYDSANSVVTQTFNGTSWSSGGNLNTARQAGGTATNGSTSAMLYAGNGSASNTAETYNGTSWSSATNMNISRNYTGGSGTGADGVILGGQGLSSAETWTGGPSGGGETPASTFIPKVIFF